MSHLLAHAQELVYTLESFMPSAYQRENLNSMLGLFLEARGYPLPQHCQTKSASALRRFLNTYDWPTRKIIRTTRQHIIKAILSCCHKGRRPQLQVILYKVSTSLFGCLGSTSNVMMECSKNGLFYLQDQ